MKTKMKKNLITAMLLTTLCSVGFAVALSPATVNASAASLDAGKFEMIGGASIRVGSKLTDNTQEDNSNGIRFSAEIDVDTYDTLKANNDSVTAGTFIMPYDYIDMFGALTEEKCFGASAVYYWQTEGFDTTDTEDDVYDKDIANRTQIRHIAGNVYKTDSEIQTGDTPVEVYRINGSLVNILPENLGKSMIGVSYLAVKKGDNTTYYFAETDADANQRSIVHVSQNTLLKYGAEGEYSSYATDYLQNYINKNSGLTMDIKADYYEIDENGYTKRSSTVVETVNITSVEDFTKDYGDEREEGWTPTLEGYKYADGHQKNVEVGKLKLDGSASYEYYFYAENNFVLYDGSYAPTVKENLKKFMGTSEVASGGYLQIGSWTPNAYEIDNNPDGCGGISASTNETGFGVGEPLRWVDFGDSQSTVYADWTWNNDPSLRTSYVELTPSMQYTYTLRVKTVKDSDVAADGLQGKSLKMTFCFMNSEKNFENIEVDIASQLHLIAENDGWYTITGTLKFINGAPGQYITQLFFQTTTATPIHLDIDYISLKIA